MKCIQEVLEEVGQVKARHSQGLTALGIWSIFYNAEPYPCSQATKDDKIFTLLPRRYDPELCEVFLSNGEKLLKGAYCSRFVLVRSDKTLEDFL